MATFGALPGGPGGGHAHHHHHGPMPGVQVHMGGGLDHDRIHDHDEMANPLLNLFRSIGMIAPGTNMGDFVSSQEGLDRIISQLMEQTATSNAPPPATQADIDNLPRKKVDESMLGDEHKAECSICMDEVNIGEEVTVLPCKHWFHHQCVGAWLLEHDTCPHCRKGITKQAEGQSNNPSSGAQSDIDEWGRAPHNTARIADEANARDRGSRSMPGAFDS